MRAWPRMAAASGTPLRFTRRRSTRSSCASRSSRRWALEGGMPLLVRCVFWLQQETGKLACDASGCGLLGGGTHGSRPHPRGEARPACVCQQSSCACISLVPHPQLDHNLEQVVNAKFRQYMWRKGHTVGVVLRTCTQEYVAPWGRQSAASCRTNVWAACLCSADGCACVQCVSMPCTTDLLLLCASRATGHHQAGPPGPHAAAQGGWTRPCCSSCCNKLARSCSACPAGRVG